MKKNFYDSENERFFRYFSFINLIVIVDLYVERGDTMEEQRRHVNESKNRFIFRLFLTYIYIFYNINNCRLYYRLLTYFNRLDIYEIS